MTPAEMDQAIKDSVLIGWGMRGGLTSYADAELGRCNVLGCLGYTATANGAGQTIEQFMPALILQAGDPLAEPPIPPDESGIRAHMASAKELSDGLDARSCAWSYTDGLILVWLTSDKAATELHPMWAGAIVTTQAYRAQAITMGATITDMADALADLVEGDSTAFDLIMSA